MSQLRKIGRQFLQDDSGQDLIEYALAACLIALSAITAMRSLATAIVGAYTHINSSFNSAI